MSESLIKRRDRPLGRAPLDAMLLAGLRPHSQVVGLTPNRTSNSKTSRKPRDEDGLEAQNFIRQPVCSSIASAMQPGAQISPLKSFWPRRHLKTGFENSRGLKMGRCVILLLMAAMTTSNFCTCLDIMPGSGALAIGGQQADSMISPLISSSGKKIQTGPDFCAPGGCLYQLVTSNGNNQPTGVVAMTKPNAPPPITGLEAVTSVSTMVGASAAAAAAAAATPANQALMPAIPSRELMFTAASGDKLEPLEVAASKKKKKMMKKKKKMEKKHKEWKKGKKHKKKKYESKKKKGGSMKKKKGKKEKKKWGKEMKGHKKKGNFKKKKWGHKKKMKKGHKKGKKGHKMLKDKGHKKKGFKKVYHKEEWGKKKKWHDIKREKKWNTKQKKWKKKWHQEKGKKYKGKHMKKYKKENKHGKKYKKEKKSKWKKHKGEKFKKGHKKKKEEYSKKKEGGKKKKMKKEMKKMKKKKG